MYATGLGIFGIGGKKKPSRDDSKRAVQQIYLELLERDPWNPYDAGAEGYVNCLVEGWCDVDFVRTEVLKSAEYGDVQRRKAEAVYGAPLPGTSASVPGAYAGAVSVPGFSALGGFDVGRYLPYILGGVLLISLMKKR